MWGSKGNIISPYELEPSCYAEQVSRYQDFPDFPNGSMNEPLKILAQQKGVRVMLTGYGGDEWLTGSTCYYADLLRQFKIISLIRQIRADPRVDSTIFPPFLILRLALCPLLPYSARGVIKRVMRRREKIPPWMCPQFAHGLHLTERCRRKPAKRDPASFVQLHLYHNILTNGSTSYGLELEDRAASRFDLEQRHPFNDQRVVEFAMALPEEQRWQRGQAKYVLRQALRGLLPESVRQRRDKAEFSHVFAKALQAQKGEYLFSSLIIASIGWVDGAELVKMYRQMMLLFAQGDERYCELVWPLWMVFGIELWYKTVFLNGEGFPLEGFRIQAASAQSV